MTQPNGGDPNNGTALGSSLPGAAGSVPLNSDGTPNFPSLIPGLGTGSTDSSGALNIWNLPSEIDGSKPIWFDVGHKQVLRDSYNTPAGVVPAQSAGVSSREILRSPIQIMKQFAAMSFNDPAKFIALQKALASGPWGTVYATGAFDGDTEKALGNAMLQYVKISAGAGVGVSFSDYLLQTAQRAQELGGDGTSAGTNSGSSSSQPPQLQVTDPASIRAAAQSAAEQALGKGLSERKLNDFVQYFQEMQKRAETSIAPVVASPDLNAEATQFVQEAAPRAYAANKQQSYQDALTRLLMGGSPTPASSTASITG